MTIEPPPASRIAGIAALVPRNTPLALMSITRSHSSSLVSSTLLTTPMPALLTSMSNFPKRLTAADTADPQADSSVTSSLTNTHSPPASLIAASVRRPSSSSTSPITTFAPSCANILASVAPMPLAPPLISATLPSSLISHAPAFECGGSSFRVL